MYYYWFFWLTGAEFQSLLGEKSLAKNNEHADNSAPLARSGNSDKPTETRYDNQKRVRRNEPVYKPVNRAPKNPPSSDKYHHRGAPNYDHHTGPEKVNLYRNQPHKHRPEPREHQSSPFIFQYVVNDDDDKEHTLPGKPLHKPETYVNESNKVDINFNYIEHLINEDARVNSRPHIHQGIGPKIHENEPKEPEPEPEPEVHVVDPIQPLHQRPTKFDINPEYLREVSRPFPGPQPVPEEKKPLHFIHDVHSSPPCPLKHSYNTYPVPTHNIVPDPEVQAKFTHWENEIFKTLRDRFFDCCEECKRKVIRGEPCLCPSQVPPHEQHPTYPKGPTGPDEPEEHRHPRDHESPRSAEHVARKISQLVQALSDGQKRNLARLYKTP